MGRWTAPNGSAPRAPSPEDDFCRSAPKSHKISEYLALSWTESLRRGLGADYSRAPGPEYEPIAELASRVRGFRPIRLSPRFGSHSRRNRPGGCEYCGDTESYRSPCDFCIEDNKWNW